MATVNHAELAKKAKGYSDAKAAYDRSRQQIERCQAELATLQRQHPELEHKLHWAELELRAAACGLPVECFELEEKALAERQQSNKV